MRNRTLNVVDEIVKLRYANRSASRTKAFSGSYADYLATSYWQRVRVLVMRRDAGKCRQCGNVADDVHHKTYRGWFKEKLSDLEAICRQCHANEHGKRSDLDLSLGNNAGKSMPKQIREALK